MSVDEDSSRHVKAGGTSYGWMRPFIPSETAVTPALARIGSALRGIPVTSRVETTVDGARPNWASRSCVSSMPKVSIAASARASSALVGYACHVMWPASTAALKAAALELGHERPSPVGQSR